MDGWEEEAFAFLYIKSVTVSEGCGFLEGDVQFFLSHFFLQRALLWGVGWGGGGVKGKTEW